jgi:hypothetical protein
LALETEVRRLISAHGATAVQRAVRKATQKKRGRKAEGDWANLDQAIVQDAIAWLDGEDPFALRSNYQLANEYSERFAGQSRQSTHRRIMRKLSERRRWYFILTAWSISESQRPFADYFRAAEAVAATSPKLRQFVTEETETYRGHLERYRARIGEPEPSKSIKEIESAAQNLPVNSLAELLRTAAPRLLPRP